MTGWEIVLVIAAYFLLLIIISRLTAGKGDNDTFFTGNRNSPWYVVAFGMIGASLSGVTFISIPGWVENSQFSYMQMVLGYLAGYAVIALILLPLYYRLNLTSIYTYLDQRFGNSSYLSGALFFIFSRIIGASFRLFLVAMVFDQFIFKQLEIDLAFHWIVLITIALIWVYTNKGGIKTVIWTDTLQTTFMLLAVVLTIVGIQSYMGLNLGELIDQIAASNYSKIFYFDNIGGESKHFVKQFLGGMFIAIAMTGLDQDMMQKNLTCRNLKDAQKNMLWFSIVLVFVNLMFLALGALLYMYAGSNGIEASGDLLFPSVAFHELMPGTITVCFVLGLIASAYSSADSALTSLTTSFTVDVLQIEKRDMNMSRWSKKQIRQMVHIGMSLILVVVIVIFNQVKDESVIEKLFKVASYTYGPLLGLYSFGLFTKKIVYDKWVPLVAIASPIICYVLNSNSENWFNYKFGFELLLLNGLITFIGLLAISKADGRTAM